jgi:hypothetical protein
MPHKPLDATDSAPPCGSRELKRLKIAMGIVMLISLFVIAMAFTFGDQPRAFVDRMNLVLGPLVVAALALCGYTLWRFRRACAASGNSRHQ